MAGSREKKGKNLQDPLMIMEREKRKAATKKKKKKGKNDSKRAHEVFEGGGFRAKTPKRAEKRL